jgi:hypothetical protein
MADMEVPLPRSTAGELFPDGSCLELILRPESDEMEFAFVRGQKTSVGTSFEVDGHTYAPAPIDSSFHGDSRPLHAIWFSRRCLSPRELFSVGNVVYRASPHRAVFRN